MEPVKLFADNVFYRLPYLFKKDLDVLFIFPLCFFNYLQVISPLLWGSLVFTP